MFDLERAVLDWRHEMSRQEAISIDMLDELECHLLEEFDSLCSAGMEEEPAYSQAIRTLGSGAALHNEIAKIDPDSVTRTRGRWILIGFLIGPLAFSGVALVISTVVTAYYFCLPESWRSGGQPSMGLQLDTHSLVIVVMMVITYCIGLRWLTRRPGFRCLHKCASYARRPLSLAAGVVALTFLLGGIRLLQNLWLARRFGPEDIGDITSMRVVPYFVAACLLPLLCLGFLRQWRKGSGTHSAAFWATSGWLLLHVCWSFCGAVQKSIILVWVLIRQDHWQVSSWLYSRRYNYNEWDAVLLLSPLAVLLGLLVVRGGSGFLRRLQALILWAIHHPIVSGSACLVGTISVPISSLVLRRSLSLRDFGSVGLVDTLMRFGWLVMLPLIWGLALRRLHGERANSEPVPAPCS